MIYEADLKMFTDQYKVYYTNWCYTVGVCHNICIHRLALKFDSDYMHLGNTYIPLSRYQPG